MKNEQSQAQYSKQIAFQKFDIIYLPHYEKMDVFVSPGYPKFNKREYSAVELYCQGAKRIDINLLNRHKNEENND